MTQADSVLPAGRRAVYLQAALRFREMAKKASSLEARDQLMQLAVLYEELAEYTLGQGAAVHERQGARTRRR